MWLRKNLPPSGWWPSFQCITVCASDMTKCVATAVRRNSGSFGRNHDTACSMTASSSLASQFSTYGDPCSRHSTKHCRRHSTGADDASRHRCVSYRRAACSVRATVEANAAIRSNFVTAFRVSGVVPAFRWSTISWRSRWISLMLSFMCVVRRLLGSPPQCPSWRRGQCPG